MNKNYDLNTNSIQIDIFKLLRIYKRKLLLIILIASIGIFLGMIFNFIFVKQKFSSTATIYFELNEVELQKTILTSRSVLEEIIKKNNLNISYQEMLDMLKIKNKNNERICLVTIESNDSSLSKTIVDDIIINANMQLQENFNSNFKIVEYGMKPSSQSNLSYWKMGIIGGVSFLLFILLYLFFDMNLNEKIDNEKEIEEYLNLYVFTCIPKCVDRKKEKNMKKVEKVRRK